MLYHFLDYIKYKSSVFVAFTLIFIITLNVFLNIDLRLGLSVIVVFLAIMALYLVYLYPVIALIFYLTLVYFSHFFLERVFFIKGIPMGVVWDGLNFVLLLILYFRGQLKGHKTQIGSLLLLWLVICVFEFFNPLTVSRVAWFQSLRIVLNGILSFFIIYSLIKARYNAFKPVIITWITFTTIAVFYTYYQEFIGLPTWDRRYLYSDPHTISLFTTFGRIRKFGFATNPTENGLYLMVNALLCLGLAFTNNIKRKYFILLIVIAGLSSVAMTFTGTRTATVLFIVGMAIYVILRRHKNLTICAVIFGILLTGYIAITGGGKQLKVMTTAFDNDDPSLMARIYNQRKLREYLYKSPVGYGLGSIGFLAKRYSRHTFLASTPPDSELVRIVVELGYIGLALYLLFYFFYINKAINLLYKEKDDFNHNWSIICVALLITMLIGHYPQQIMNYNAFKMLVGCVLAYISLEGDDFKLIDLNITRKN